MDGEEPLHGGAGRAPRAPQPCWPHRSAPLASAVGPELGASESLTSPEGQSLAQGAEHKTHGTKQGESGHPAPRRVIWSVNMAGVGTRARGTVAED